MYNNSNQNCPESLFNLFSYFQDAPSIYSLRSRCKCTVILPKPQTTLFFRSINYAGGKSWNNLPVHIRHAKDIYSFKSMLKKHIVQE